MNAEILVIDDDCSLRRVLEYNLQQKGYRVQVAASGEEGLELFEASRPDLVITDMKMPGMDGLSLLRGIKERSAETLVIIITAYGEVEAAVAAMKAGAYDYITKPFNRDQLWLTVAKALRFRGMAEENRRLKSELSDRGDFRAIVGSSPAMERVFQVIRKVADTEATILISGESGTGKELVARSLHATSSRHGAPFVAINCSAVPRELLESELFGHVRGAFTGAVRDREGKFQCAEGGTIFLDEVGELPLELQPKLLRVLQEREVTPVGATETRKLDVRVIAATNLDLERAVDEGAFREDLYYRLAVIPIHLPPLRERREDIPLLIRHFCAKHGGTGVTLAGEALELLRGYSWPGNVRELENAVERMLVMRDADLIGVGDLPERVRSGTSAGSAVVRLPDEGYSLERLEREVVQQALERNQWNQAAAARFLRIPRHTLLYRIEKYAIQPPEQR